jgi:hypothetical protein
VNVESGFLGNIGKTPDAIFGTFRPFGVAKNLKTDYVDTLSHGAIGPESIIMRRSLCLQGAMAVAVVLSMAQHSKAAMIVYPSGASDAVAHRHWVPSFGNWIDSETSPNLTTYWSTASADMGWDIPVLEFPLAGVPANSATLNFYVSVPGQLSMRANYVGGDNDGVVSTAEWLDIGSVVGTFDGAETGWHSFNITSQLQTAVAAGYSWIVFSIRPDASGGSTTVAASENTAFAPYLSVVPEPSAIVLLGLGAVGLLVSLWRRRAA